MKQHIKSFARRWLFLILTLALVMGMAGCGSTPSPEPTATPTDTPEPTATPAPPSAPTLDQSSTITLEAGAKLPVIAHSEGASSYSWSLQGDGEISTNTGPVVIYTAPDEEGGVAILSVTAYSESGLASPTTNMTINIKPGKVTLTSFDIVAPKGGDKLVPNQQITCSGTYTLSRGNDTTSIHVWILVGDVYGNYYLQNPPVSFEVDGTWSTSIQPGSGITKIFAVLVTEEGNDSFQRRVSSGDFSGFTTLPDGSLILDSIDIQT